MDEQTNGDMERAACWCQVCWDWCAVAVMCWCLLLLVHAPLLSPRHLSLRSGERQMDEQNNGGWSVLPAGVLVLRLVLGLERLR